MGEGLIFLLAGPAGAGKNTILKRVLFLLPDLEPIVTYTTRDPREDEVPEVDHHFVTVEEFERMKSAGELAESQFVSGHQYGSSTRRLEEAIEQGVDLISDYDVLGCEALAKLYADNVVSIFVWVPPEVSRQRHIGRDGAGSPEIAKREERQKMEMSRLPFFKYVVTNIDLWEAVCNVVGIVRAERCLVSRRPESLGVQ
jgi:guanylate kinase